MWKAPAFYKAVRSENALYVVAEYRTGMHLVVMLLSPSVPQAQTVRPFVFSHGFLRRE